MSIIKNLLKFFAFISAGFVTVLSIIFCGLATLFSGITATGSTMREMQENDLSFDKDVDLDKFTCEKKTDSIFSYTCSNGHAKALHTRKFNKKLNEKYEL